MPYFIYNVTADKRLTRVESHATFKEARQRARVLREEMPAGSDYVVKVIFAKDAEEAERLLTTEREFIPTGDD